MSLTSFLFLCHHHMDMISDEPSNQVSLPTTTPSKYTKRKKRFLWGQHLMDRKFLFCLPFSVVAHRLLALLPLVKIYLFSRGSQFLWLFLVISLFGFCLFLYHLNDFFSLFIFYLAYRSCCLLRIFVLYMITLISTSVFPIDSLGLFRWNIIFLGQFWLPFQYWYLNA